MFFNDEALSAEGDVVVVVLLVASDVLDDFDEGWEVDVFLFGNAFRLEYHEIVDGLVEEVYLEVLALPDERAACLADGGAIGVGLLQERLIQGVAHLALSLKHFSCRDALLGLMNVDGFTSAPLAATQTHLAVGVCHQVGLGNLALDALRQLASEFDDIDALLGDRLG